MTLKLVITVVLITSIAIAAHFGKPLREQDAQDDRGL